MPGVNKVVVRQDSNATFATAATALNTFLEGIQPDDVQKISFSVASDGAGANMYVIETQYVNTSTKAGVQVLSVTSDVNATLATLVTNMNTVLADIPTDDVISTQIEVFHDGTNFQYASLIVSKGTV